MSRCVEFELLDLSPYPKHKQGYYKQNTNPLQDPALERIINFSINDDDKTWTKRCINCHQYYHASNNTSKSCVYHTGVLRDVYTSQAVSGALKRKWSCCGSDDSAGCKVGKHVEGIDFLGALNSQHR